MLDKRSSTFSLGTPVRLTSAVHYHEIKWHGENTIFNVHMQSVKAARHLSTTSGTVRWSEMREILASYLLQLRFYYNLFFVFRNWVTTLLVRVVNNPFFLNSKEDVEKFRLSYSALISTCKICILIIFILKNRNKNLRSATQTLSLLTFWLEFTISFLC